MKNTAFALFFLLHLYNVGAQNIQNGTGFNHKTNISRQTNGKYSYASAACRDTSSTIIITRSGKGEPIQPVSINKTTETPVTTYHVVIHFDQMPYDVICNGADTIFMTFYNMNWINNFTAVEAYMPEGFYDILVVFPDGMYRNLYVFVKDFHVNMDRDTTILSTSANRVVTLNGVDENNVLLPELMESGDALQISIEFPDNFKLVSYSGAIRGTITDYVKFSDVRSDIKILLGETAVLKPDQYNRYEITYQAMMGITKDTILSNSPSEYRNYTLIHHATPASHEPYYLYGCGIMANCLLGPRECIVVAFGSEDYPSQQTDTLRVFTSNVAVDTNKYLFCYQLYHCEYNPWNASGMNKSIDNAYYYVTPGNELVFSASGKFPPVTGDYMVANGEVAHLADNAPFNACFTVNDPVGYLIRIFPWFSGQACERRWIDKAVGTYDIWEGNQFLHHDSIGLNNILWYATGPGIYSVVLNDSNYLLSGKPGFSRTTLTFDLGAEDPNTPVIKTMQILMGSEIATNIIHGYSASMQFTAGDWPLIPSINKTVYRPLKDVHLYYKNFFESNWMELDLQSHPPSLDSLLGMPYSADLEPILAQYPDSAWIDLKIELIDSAGNSNVQTIHPAFLIRDAITGIKPLLNDFHVSIYPNPATDKINIITAEKDVNVTIFASNGQSVKEVVNIKEIDVNNLEPGFYTVRIKNIINGRASYSKFIKNK